MITVFLPCRAGSQRIPQKNTKKFAQIEGGLLAIKLEQLLKVPEVSKIVLSTNDYEVIRVAKTISEEIVIDIRPENLASSETSTDELIQYVPNIIQTEHILWTHVTSPFLNENFYSQIIEKYLSELKLGNFDSLMTVNKIQTFLWTHEGSFNYDREKEKWPRTQTLPELYEVNSGVFINSLDNYLNFKDRIGKKPFLYRTEGLSSFDIDWPEDFDMAENLYKNIVQND